MAIWRERAAGPLGESLMSRAEELIERIRTRGLPAVDELIADAAAEELFLDFKRSANTGLPRLLPKEDARHFAKAISGFGNAEGGIIVWGIDCRVDRATGALSVTRAPLPDVATFRARLEEAISRSSTPPHPGVENFEVLDGTGTSGYVVTLVPKAEFGPIRAIAKVYVTFGLGRILDRVARFSVAHAGQQAVFVDSIDTRPSNVASP